MADLSTARTRLGIFGYVTRRTGAFLRHLLSIVGTNEPFKVSVEDAAVTRVAISETTGFNQVAVSDTAVTSITLTEGVL